MKYQWYLLALFSQLILCTTSDTDESAVGQADYIFTTKFGKVNRLVQSIKLMLNNSVTDFQTSSEFVGSGSKNDDNTKQLTIIHDRITNIEQTITELFNRNDGNVQYRINDLEDELENIKKLLDNKLKENRNYQRQLEESLQNVSNAYNDLTKRLLKLEEPERLKELETKLNGRDYYAASQDVQFIVNNHKVKDVIRSVYQKQNDFDALLYFASFINDVPKRLIVYEQLIDIIKFNENKLPELEEERRNHLGICNRLKLINKLELENLKTFPTSCSERHSSALIYLKNSLKKMLLNLSHIHKFKVLEKNTYGYDIDVQYFMNDTVAVLGDSDGSGALFQYVFSLDNINREAVDCWFEFNFRLVNINMIRDIALKTYTYARQSNRLFKRIPMLNLNQKGKKYSLNNDVEQFKIALMNNNFIQARAKYSLLQDDEDRINAIKYVFNAFEEVDKILSFGDHLGGKQHVIIYAAVYDVIDKTSTVNICNMLKLLDKLEKNNLYFLVINLKQFISTAIKKEIIHLEHEKLLYKIVQSDYNRFLIYTKNENSIIGRYEYYLLKNQSNVYCYFKGGVSISTYDKWYQKYKEFMIIGWLPFVYIITKSCYIM